MISIKSSVILFLRQFIFIFYFFEASKRKLDMERRQLVKRTASGQTILLPRITINSTEIITLPYRASNHIELKIIQMRTE